MIIVRRKEIKGSLGGKWWRVRGHEYHITGAPHWERLLFVVLCGWHRPMIRFMYRNPAHMISEIGA